MSPAKNTNRVGTFYVPEGQYARIVAPQKYWDFYGEELRIRGTRDGYEILSGVPNQRIDPRLMGEDWVLEPISTERMLAEQAADLTMGRRK